MLKVKILYCSSEYASISIVSSFYYYLYPTNGDSINSLSQSVMRR